MYNTITNNIGNMFSFIPTLWRDILSYTEINAYSHMCNKQLNNILLYNNKPVIYNNINIQYKILFSVGYSLI